jgi:Glycoside Hydrolase Family 113
VNRAFRDQHLAGVAVALCVLSAVSACSVVAPRYYAGSSTPGVSTKPRPASAAPSVAAVPHPWHSGMPQLGIDVDWAGNSVDSDAVIRAKAERIIDYAIGLHANSIALTFPFYTYGITSDTLYADKVTTPSPEHIAIFISMARESRIRVTIRPLLSEEALVGQNPIAWRGSIQPASLSAWFASYQKLLLPYAKVAESGHAATFVIGAELNSLEGAAEWPTLVQAIGSVYHGELAYDENFDSFQNHDTNLPLSAFGVDAYPRFQLPDSASVSELTQAWVNWLSSHSNTVLHKTVLSEVGITATSGAYQSPGNWLGTAHAAIVPRIQANWYAAVCHAFAADKLAGLYWWEVSFDADPGHPAAFLADRLTFLDRPAQQEISSCFASLTAAENGNA